MTSYAVEQPGRGGLCPELPLIRNQQRGVEGHFLQETELKRRLLQFAAGEAIFTAGPGVSIITVITHGPAAAHNEQQGRVTVTLRRRRFCSVWIYLCSRSNYNLSAATSHRTDNKIQRLDGNEAPEAPVF